MRNMWKEVVVSYFHILVLSWCLPGGTEGNLGKSLARIVYVLVEHSSNTSENF
jgi:hypothetical protein